MKAGGLDATETRLRALYAEAHYEYTSKERLRRLAVAALEEVMVLRSLAVVPRVPTP